MPARLYIEGVETPFLDFKLKHSKSKIIPELHVKLPVDQFAVIGDDVKLFLDDFKIYDYSEARTTGPEDVVEEGLQVCLKFEDNLDNSAPVAYQVSTLSPPIFEDNGKNGKAMYGGKRITISDIEDNDISSFDDWSMTIWYKSGGMAVGSFAKFIGGYTTSRLGNVIAGYGTYLMIDTSGNLVFNQTTNNATLATISGGAVHDQAWHHIALVRENDMFRVYLDGVQQGVDTAAGNVPLTEDFTIGGYFVNNLGTDDLIDDFCLWDRAISLSEINAIRNFVPSFSPRFRKALNIDDGDVEKPTLRYEFEDDTDSTGSNTQAITVGSAATYADAKYGKGFAGGGVGATSLLSQNGSIMEFDDEFTISMWLGKFVAGANNDYIMYGTGTNAWGFRIVTDGTEQKIRFIGFSMNLDCGDVSGDEFVNIVLTYDGTSIYTIYRNGETLHRFNSTLQLGQTNVYFGNNNGASSMDAGDGIIDELRYYGFGLLHQQVRRLYLTNSTDFKEVTIVGQPPQESIEDRVDLNFGGTIRKYNNDSTMKEIIAVGYLNKFKDKDYGITYYDDTLLGVAEKLIGDVFPNMAVYKSASVVDNELTSIIIDGKLIRFIRRILEYLNVCVTVNINNDIIFYTSRERSSRFIHGVNCAIYEREADDTDYISEVHRPLDDYTYTETDSVTTITNDRVSGSGIWVDDIVPRGIPQGRRGLGVSSASYDAPISATAANATSVRTTIMIVFNDDIVRWTTPEGFEGVSTYARIYSELVDITSGVVPSQSRNFVEGRLRINSFRTNANSARVTMTANSGHKIVSWSILFTFFQRKTNTVTTTTTAVLGRREITKVSDDDKSELIPESARDVEWRNAELDNIISGRAIENTYDIVIPGIFVGLDVGDRFVAESEPLNLSGEHMVSGVEIDYGKGQTKITIGGDKRSIVDAFLKQEGNIDDAVEYVEGDKVSIAYDPITTDAQAQAFLRKIGYLEEE